MKKAKTKRFVVKEEQGVAGGAMYVIEDFPDGIHIGYEIWAPLVNADV